MTSVDVEQTTRGQVVDQGRKRQVGRRVRNVLEPVKDVRVGVPVGELAVVLTIVDGDEPDSRLDQPTGQHHALPLLGPAIMVAEPGVFLVQVERLAHRR